MLKSQVITENNFLFSWTCVSSRLNKSTYHTCFVIHPPSQNNTLSVQFTGAYYFFLLTYYKTLIIAYNLPPFAFTTNGKSPGTFRISQELYYSHVFKGTAWNTQIWVDGKWWWSHQKIFGLLFIAVGSFVLQSSSLVESESNCRLKLVNGNPSSIHPFSLQIRLMWHSNLFLLSGFTCSVMSYDHWSHHESHLFRLGKCHNSPERSTRVVSRSHLRARFLMRLREIRRQSNRDEEGVERKRRVQYLWNSAMINEK